VKTFETYFKSRYILESPEVVADIYERDNYDFEFFLGDEEGALVVPNEITKFASHSDIVRYLVMNDFMDRKTYELKNLDSFPYDVAGEPKIIDLNYSGIILPSQISHSKETKDVKKTYISFWTKEGVNALQADVLLDYCKKMGYDGPIEYEVMVGEFESKTFPSS
jgi:hypothetical protein